jgi:hypothetical protein
MKGSKDLFRHGRGGQKKNYTQKKGEWQKHHKGGN